MHSLHMHTATAHTEEALFKSHVTAYPSYATISCHTSMHFLPQLFFFLKDIEVYNPQVSKNPIILVLYLCH